MDVPELDAVLRRRTAEERCLVLTAHANESSEASGGSTVGGAIEIGVKISPKAGHGHGNDNRGHVSTARSARGGDASLTDPSTIEINLMSKLAR